MGVVADADEAWDKRRNVLEDVTMDDSMHDGSVSTITNLVVARSPNSSCHARYSGGQISDKSYQRLMGNLSKLSSKNVGSDGQGVTEMHGDVLGPMSCGGTGAGVEPWCLNNN
ncbi:hypothetical protein QL093DRAFT_2370549 [Fusarium oxysporum]|nr:hypothetical protein QL093DRAFT_2370549 [Fusarium oxysporum]